MASQILWTWQDVFSHLLDWSGTTTVDAATVRRVNGAILAAYRHVPMARNWTYYQQRRSFATTASQAASTITYDHTGGANERMVTLASGSWPSDAARGWITISNHSYKVESRESSSIITLSVNSNPGADVAAGTSYQWYRDTYPLPLDFQSMGNLRDINTGDVLFSVTLDEALHERVAGDDVGQPEAFAVVNDPDYIGAMAIILTPPPDSAYTYDFPMQRRPRDLTTRQYNTGTVTTSSTAVTGASTAFTSAHIGSVIRFSSDGTNAPTSQIGTNPYNSQRIIVARTSATAITIDAALSSEVAAVKYEISCPIDIEQGSMFNAFLRYAEYELGVSQRRDDVPKLYQVYQTSLRSALEGDSRVWLGTGTPDISRVLIGDIDLSI